MWRSEMSYSIIENFGVTWATNTVCSTFAAGKRCRFGKNCSFLHERPTQKQQEKITPQSDAMVVEENVNESIAQAFQKHPKAPVMIDVRKKLPLDGITLDSVEQSQPTWQYYVWCKRIILFIFCVRYIEFESYKSENNENTSYRKLKRKQILS